MALPSCFDRADGVTPFPNGYGGYNAAVGTPDPSGAVIVSGPSGSTIPTQESPDSPEIERAEQGTITKTFTLGWNEAATQILTLGRGRLEIDNYDNVTRVLSSKIKHQRGNKAELVKVSESVSFDTPIDEFGVTPFELGINIMKHPRYFYALDPTDSDISVTVAVNDINVSLSTVKQTIIRATQTYQDSPFFPSADNINGLIQNNTIGQLNGTTIQCRYPNSSFDPDVYEVAPKAWSGITAERPTGNMRYYLVPVPTSNAYIQLALAAAKEIITKVWRQEDTPYVVGHKIHHVRYYYRPPFVNPGGYLENPITEASPGLPDYFGSPSLDYSIDTIFDHIADHNPQCYKDPATGLPNISCLRQADELEYQRTWFKLTRTWVCVPVGHWDVDLYANGVQRPTISNYTSAPPVGYRPLTA